MWVVCWDISPGHLTGYNICLGRPLLLTLLLCYPWTFECTLASAHVERQTCLFECAIHILGSTPNARLPAMLLEHHPNHRERNATSTRKGNSDCKTNAIGCRLNKVKGQRVYMLLLSPGVHNKLATGFSRVCSKPCYQCGDGTHSFLLTIW